MGLISKYVWHVGHSNMIICPITINDVKRFNMPYIAIILIKLSINQRIIIFLGSSINKYILINLFDIIINIFLMISEQQQAVAIKIM